MAQIVTFLNGGDNSAWCDVKARVVTDGYGLPSDVFDAGQRRSLFDQIDQESFEGIGFALHFNGDFARAVLHAATQTGTGSQAKNERAKGDTLHDSLNDNGTAFTHRRLASVGPWANNAFLFLGTARNRVAAAHPTKNPAPSVEKPGDAGKFMPMFSGEPKATAFQRI